MYIVILENGGEVWYLRGTTWTSQKVRANTFAESSDAATAIDKARKFMKPALRKLPYVTNHTVDINEGN